jgi:hypothetical protein
MLTFTRSLAEAQQKRSKNAQPLLAADNDDRTVTLERSDLGVPVYWLGLDFTPSGLPPATLADTAGPLGPGSSPGNRLKIDYRPIQPAAAAMGGIEPAVWEPAAWAAFTRSELGDLSTQPPCGDPQVIQLADRRVEVHAPGTDTGPPLSNPPPPSLTQPPVDASNSVEDRCPRNYVGQVYFADAVVVINGINCLACGYAAGPYNSAAAIEAIARGLVRR